MSVQLVESVCTKNTVFRVKGWQYYVGYIINGRYVGSLPMSRFNSVYSAYLDRGLSVLIRYC